MTLLRFIFLAYTVSSAAFADLRTFHIVEEVPSGTKIVNLGKLFNINQNKEAIVTISNTQALGIDYFQIDRITLDLVVRKSPDRDEICPNIQDHCYIPLLILYGNINEPSYDQISVEILDVNDNSPIFPQNEIQIFIPENNLDNNFRESTLKLLEATDKDTKENGVKLYKIDGADSITFKVEMDRKGPRLGLIEKLDRERKSKYIFKLLAIDGGTPSRTGTLIVTVHVEDINDNKPRFSQPQYKAIISEDTPIGTTILTFYAIDNDVGVNGKIGFRLPEASNQEEQLANSLFKIVVLNMSSCALTIARNIDCRNLVRDKLEFYVEAYDHGVPPFTSTTLIDIQIIDINNNPPNIFVQYITDKTKTLKVENKNVGTLVENQSRSMIAQISVKDLDKSIGNDISCKTNDSRFYLDEITTLQAYPNRFAFRIYRLFNNIVIDREKIDVLHLLLICEDNIHRQATQQYSFQKSQSIIQLTSTELITILILDVNDEAPQFPEKNLSFFLPENKPEIINENEIKSMYKLGYVKATDKDSDENGVIEYSILVNMHNAFKIIKDTGALYVIRPFDREQNSKVSITVMAQDCPTSGERRSSSTEVKVTITDENDSVPKFDEHNYHFRVSENIDHAILNTVSAIDADEGENAIVHYELTKINYGLSNKEEHYTNFNNFHVDRRTGQIRLRKRLDREVCNHFDLVIIAIDNPMKTKTNIQNTATTNVVISVLDQNDNRPQITSPKNNQEFFIDPEQSTAGHPIFTVQAIDSDYGNNASINYEIQYGNTDLFDLDKGAGLCYLKETLTENHPRSFTLQIKAYDLGTPLSLNNTINVRIIRSKPGKIGMERTQPKSPGLFNHLSLSDKTLVIILTTIFVLLLLITGLLVAFVRYRRILWQRLNKKNPDYCKGTVMRNYVRRKSQSDDDEKNSPNEEEKYHNLFVGSQSNNDKNEKRRNQPCGYSEYGTLIHNSAAQAMANMDIATIKRDTDYQQLGHFKDIMETYQLPTSNVIMNDAAINNSQYELKPITMTRNLYISPNKRQVMGDSIYTGKQLADRNTSIDTVSRVQSLEAESTSPLMYRVYSTNDDTVVTGSRTDSRELQKYPNRTKIPASFVLKNFTATEESPKKSIFGSFV